MKIQLKRGFAMLLAIGIAISLGVQSASAYIKVACVGDSITAGYALSDPGTQSYPAQLQALLGSGYSVDNFGLSGATALKHSDFSYWNKWAYRASVQSSPDIVVIMFGTNDSKAWNWDAAKFEADYRALIAKYQDLRSRPQVYIGLIPPVYTPNPFGNTFDPVFIQNAVVPAIRNIATATGVTLIDNNTPLLNHPELFSDGVHPTTQGAGIIANEVAAAITAPQESVAARRQSPRRQQTDWRSGGRRGPEYVSVKFGVMQSEFCETYTMFTGCNYVSRRW